MFLRSFMLMLMFLGLCLGIKIVARRKYRQPKCGWCCLPFLFDAEDGHYGDSPDMNWSPSVPWVLYGVFYGRPALSCHFMIGIENFLFLDLCLHALF